MLRCQCWTGSRHISERDGMEGGGTWQHVPGTKSTSLHRQGPWAYFLEKLQLCFHAGILAAHKNWERHVKFWSFLQSRCLPGPLFSDLASQQGGGGEGTGPAKVHFCREAGSRTVREGPEVRSRFRLILPWFTG